MRRGRTRFAAALALAVALAGPVATARAADGRHETAGWSLDAFWTWLRSAVPTLQTGQSDCGIYIDPDGGCHTALTVLPRHSPRSGPPLVATAQAECDRGSQIDPNGGCHTALVVSPVNPDR